MIERIAKCSNKEGRGFVVSSGDIPMPQKLKGLSDVSFTWGR